MPIRSRLLSLWRNLFQRDRQEQALTEELQAYLEMLVETKIKEGLPWLEARRAALIEMGGVEQVKEKVREVRMGHFLETAWQDLGYGLRMLRKSPVFTAAAVFSLALGIGANTAIFSLLDTLLLKSLPVAEPDRLVLFGKAEDVGLTNGFPNTSWDLFSYPFYEEVRQHNEVFSGVASLLSLTWTVHGTVSADGAAGEPGQMDVQLVSGTYFPVLGVNASLGRTFTEADDQMAGAHPVAVVSYRWWQRRLGADPAAVGKTIMIDQTVYTIVGVTPEEFFGTTVGRAPDIWVPLAMEAQLPPAHWSGRNKEDFQSLYLIARLKNGVSAEQASAAVNLLFKQSLQERAGAQPSAERLQDIERAGIELTPAGRGISGPGSELSLSLRILMAVVGLVLLIACANIANLLLARAAARQREFAVRLAMGAGRLRLIRQLLTESLLLASLSGIAGVLLAWWGSSLLLLMASAGSKPLTLDVSPNPRLLAFTLLVSLLSAAIFGTVPALRAARVEPDAVLKGGKGAVQATSQGPLGKALVVVQVALSLVLLVGAGLFVRTLINLEMVPTGFNQENVLVFRTDIAATGYKIQEQTPLLHEVEERVKAVPGVQAASFAFMIFNQGQWTSKLFTRDHPEGQSPEFRNNIVGKDYFTAMGIPLVLGRGFGSQDTSQSQKVAVISETFAERFFPRRSPLGQRFGRTPETAEQFEIIGVVKDAKYGDLTEQSRPMVYYFYGQQGENLSNFVVRYSGPPQSIVSQVRQAIREVNRNLPIDEVVSLSEQIGRSLARQEVVARLASFFGGLALLLASVGLYGILSYAVARRTNEIGIRMALGATHRDVLWLILREALTLVTGGVVIGLAGSLAATRLAAGLLFNLQPNDPLTIMLAALLLIIVALMASCIPARQATKVDPMQALRSQ